MLFALIHSRACPCLAPDPFCVSAFLCPQVPSPALRVVCFRRPRWCCPRARRGLPALPTCRPTTSLATSSYPSMYAPQHVAPCRKGAGLCGWTQAATAEKLILQVCLKVVGHGCDCVPLCGVVWVQALGPFVGWSVRPSRVAPSLATPIATALGDLAHDLTRKYGPRTARPCSHTLAHHL